MTIVIPGLVPGIHDLQWWNKESRGCQAQGLAWQWRCGV